MKQTESVTTVLMEHVHVLHQQELMEMEHMKIIVQICRIHNQNMYY